MKMAKKFKIGFLPLTKVNWTNEIMEAQRAEAQQMLSSMEGVEVFGPDSMIDLESRAVNLLEEFEAKRPDLLVVFLATFALGTIVPLYAKRLKVPVILWTIPEPDPAGGRLRANSFCAANMNAHFLWRFHIPYFHVHGDVGAEKTAKELEKYVRLARAMDAVSKMRIGCIGGRVPGFYTSSCSEMLLRDKLGPEVKYITMLELINDAKKLSGAELEKAEAIVRGDATACVTSDENVRKSAALYAAVCGLRDKFLVDTFTFRCWPEIISDDLYGLLACSTIGHLTNHGVLTVCEGDVYAAVMLRLERELSGQDPFFCDLIVCEGDYGVLWHCGAAPCSLCREGFERRLNNSSTVPTKGAINEFPLKPGRFTLARLGETRDGSGFRMLIATGTGLDTDLFVRGNPLKVEFDAGCDKLRRTVFDNGFEHHFSMAYGDISDELEQYCRVMDIETIVVK